MSKPSSNLPNNKLEILNLFQECTLIFPELLPIPQANFSINDESEEISTLLQNYQNTFTLTMHFAFHHSSKIYEYSYKKREDKLQQLFYKSFLRFYSNFHCRAYIVVNYNPEGKPTSEKLHQIMFPKVSFGGTFYDHLLHSDFTPNYYVLISKSKQTSLNANWLPSLDIETHLTIGYPKIFLFLLNIANELISVYTGCYICPHNLGLEANINKMLIFNFVLLVTKPSSINSLEKHFVLLHKKLNGEHPKSVESRKRTYSTCFERFNTEKSNGHILIV